MAVNTFADIDTANDDPETVVSAYVSAVESEAKRTDEASVSGVKDIDGEADLLDVARILGASANLPPATMRDELLDQLLLAMSMAIVDVDALARRVPLNLGPKELQQRIEGRSPMTLREYALIRYHIEQSP